jgi:hypothetical protein
MYVIFSEMVAIGDTRGNLEIWKITRNLIT